VTLEDALEQGFLSKLQKALPADDERQEMDEAAYFEFIRSGCADEETFNQEYQCIPADDASAFITFELLDRCKYGAGVEWKKDLRDCERLYIGVDVGRKNDLFVIWAAEEEGGILFTRDVIAWQNRPYSEMEAELYNILENCDVSRCCVDATGLGNQFAERAKQRFGYKVEPVTFTGAMKEEMAYALRSRMEDKAFLIPDDRIIFSDFRGIRKETTTSGNIRFAGERTSNGHCDRFWAAALAVHAKGNTTPAFMPQAFSRGRIARALARKKKGVML
jgi:phage FluMu gp28-like protein